MKPIADEKYARLTTYTKDGRAKTTPVWIADLGDGRVGFTTDSDSWKVKRIRHTPDVMLQASNSRGTLTAGSEPARGTATVVDGAAYAEVDAAIRAKYGWQVPLAGAVYRIAALFGRGQVADRGVVITIDG